MLSQRLSHAGQRPQRQRYLLMDQKYLLTSRTFVVSPNQISLNFVRFPSLHFISYRIFHHFLFDSESFFLFRYMNFGWMLSSLLCTYDRWNGGTC